MVGVDMVGFPIINVGLMEMVYVFYSFRQIDRLDVDDFG